MVSDTDIAKPDPSLRGATASLDLAGIEIPEAAQQPDSENCRD